VIERNVRRFVADLLRGRRPRRFDVDEREAAQLRAAIALRASRPGAGAPSEEFVTDLHRRLAADLAGADAAGHGAPAPASGPIPIRRRNLVAAAGIAAGAAAVGAGVDHVFAGGPPPEAQAQQTLNPNSGRWLTVLASADLPEGGTAGFDLQTVAGFVTRSSGALSAVSGVCTHLGCRLALDAAARRLDCPCHNASFSLGGQLLRHQLAVPPRPLPHLRVRESNGMVQIFAPPGPIA
jgi:nitrite reductase/ring-hydroxylating ferredoxin subunit